MVWLSGGALGYDYVIKHMCYVNIDLLKICHISHAQSKICHIQSKIRIIQHLAWHGWDMITAESNQAELRFFFRLSFYTIII